MQASERLQPLQIVNAAAHTTVNLGVIKKVMMLARVLRMFRLLRHLRVSGGTCRLPSADWPSPVQLFPPCLLVLAGSTDAAVHPDCLAAGAVER